MKFVQVDKAQGLDLGKSVFTVNDAGEYGFGRLVERTEDMKNGKLHTFEMASFDEMGDRLLSSLKKMVEAALVDAIDSEEIKEAKECIRVYEEMKKNRGSLIVKNVIQVAIPSKVVKVNEQSGNDSTEG